MEKMIGIYHIFPFHMVPKGADIIIWGMGEVGHQYVSQIIRTNYCKISFCVDKNWDNINNVNGVNVVSPEKIKNRSEYIVIANGSNNVAAEIEKNIINYDIKQEKIVRCDLICENEMFVRINNSVSKQSLIYNKHDLNNLKRCLNSKDINIAILLRGGIGDLIVIANYIYYLKEKFNGIKIYIFCERNINAVKSIYGKDIIENYYLCSFDEIKNKKIYAVFDYCIEISRYPKNIYVNYDKIAINNVNLLNYIYTVEKFSKMNKRYMDGANYDGQSAILSVICNQKRIQQPDIDGVLGIREAYAYPIKFKFEQGSLMKFGLNDSKFIAVCNDAESSNGNHMKLWPASYLNILLQKIKERYPNILTVFIGAGKREDNINYNIDLDLRGETSLEEIKSILKHATLLISNEGGMVHLRHAVNGGSSVVIFGPTDERFFGYSENKNIRGNGCSLRCEWMKRDWFKTCAAKNFKACMLSVTPDIVMESIKEVIEENNHE